jgi:predicted dehydrogenase
MTQCFGEWIRRDATPVSFPVWYSGNMNIGILGAGGIASTMAGTIARMHGIENYAIASRDFSKAEAFRKANGMVKAYGSYEELVADPKVDLVYITTPHSQHAANALLALKYKKPVLCEKAFTANQKEARKVLSAFEKEKVFITEAIWTRYMPSRTIIRNLILSGIIGEPYLLEANLCYGNKNHARLTDPLCAGGALLDMGIYPLTFAVMAFAAYPDALQSFATMTETGVDETTALFASFGAKRAILYTSMDGVSDRNGFIYGTKGYLQVQNINNPEKITIFGGNRKPVKIIRIPHGISGYEWELRSCKKALEEKALECPEMPHSDTLTMMGLFDAIRKQIGVVYPFEKHK